MFFCFVGFYRGGGVVRVVVDRKRVVVVVWVVGWDGRGIFWDVGIRGVFFFYFGIKIVVDRVLSV